MEYKITGDKMLQVDNTFKRSEKEKLGLIESIKRELLTKYGSAKKIAVNSAEKRVLLNEIKDLEEKLHKSRTEIYGHFSNQVNCFQPGQTPNFFDSSLQ